MKPRQYVHGLLIISYAITFCCCLLMIIKYDRTSMDHKLWIGCKILTVKNFIKINNEELYPILNFNPDGTSNEYEQNYKSLLKHSRRECGANYKKCGILDTYKNIMCIPKEDDCPINNMIVDLISKSNEYISKGYEYVHIENFPEDYALYYTNKEIDKEIIVKYIFSEEIPKYINQDNFIFDNETYDSHYSYGDSDYDDDDGYRYEYGYDDDDDDGYGGWGGGDWDFGDGGGGFRNLDDLIYGDSLVDSYIRNKFNEEINIDKSFKKIYDNFYIGSYIGFKDNTDLNNFNEMDLHESYFTAFPNYTADVFCYFSLIAMICLSIFSFCRFFYEDDSYRSSNNCCVCTVKIIIIIIYASFFIGYYSYCLYEYFNIYKNRNPEDLKKIRADYFLENLLDEIYNRHLNVNYIISIIILFSCCLVIYIISWILSIFFTNRFTQLKYISRYENRY